MVPVTQKSVKTTPEMRTPLQKTSSCLKGVQNRGVPQYVLRSFFSLFLARSWSAVLLGV